MHTTAAIKLMALIAGILTAAIHADEPDNEVAAQGIKELKEYGRKGVPIYTENGEMGTLKLAKGKIIEGVDVIVDLGSAKLSRNPSWEAKAGDVYFNVGKVRMVKAGDYLLGKGEGVLFANGQFVKSTRAVGVTLSAKETQFASPADKGADRLAEQHRSPVPNAAPKNWPVTAGDLRGGMEVRVRNPNEFSVKVGLRSGGKGKDFSVSADGVQSVFVPNGRYEIYFQYSTDPDGLYQGDSFTLSNNGVEIKIVKVVNGNYGIRKVR